MNIAFVYPQYLWLLLLVPLTIGLGVLGQRSLSRARLWNAIVLRSVLLLAIIFALAGIQLRLRSNILTTVFILDVSDSIPPAEQARGEDYIRRAASAMTRNDRAAVIAFGEDALVESLASEKLFLSDLTSIPITTRTDIASALQLAQAIFPNEGAKRMVLLSDGRQNLGQALEQAGLASANQIELLYIALGELQADVEVSLEQLDAPSDAHQGENIPLRITVRSSQPVEASLRVFADGSLVQTQEMHLNSGTNSIQAEIPAAQPGSAGEKGFRRFRVQIIPDQDTRLQNNEASAFTVIHGPPNILLAEGQPGDGENLRRALSTSGMQVTQISPTAIPINLDELAGFQAIILVNVNANDLPAGLMDTLPVYVRDLGMGLLMVGGSDTFGAGGYLRTPLEKALPVDMDVKDKELQSNLALVLAVDKSGSMGRCHCDNPDLNQTYTRAEVGQPKVDIAKEAIMRAASAIGQQDYLGVVAFDSAAHWVQRIAPLVDPYSLEQAIGTFQAEGSTNLETGVQAAYQTLQGVSARRKHIILMTDGWVRQGDLTALAARMKDQGITLSIVAAGEGSALYLANLAEVGGGRYYPATDILNVPDIFLKETVTSVGQYIVEEAFYPLPADTGPELRGLDLTNLPPLLGYNGTTAKKTARLDLLTPRGDPLLATWQFGLGRSAAWTSDLKGQWAKNWIEWQSFPRFAAQLVEWLLPAPQTEGLEASAALEDGQAVIRLRALDKQGRPLNFLQGTATLIYPDLQTQELQLEQVGPGQYQAAAQASTPGTYLIRLGVNQSDQSLGQITLGLVVPYSPEYKTSGTDRALLGEIARITGGSEIATSEDGIPDIEAAFDRNNLPFVDYAREIWYSLLLLVALLFPLDVAIRRVILSPSDLRKARAWLLARVPDRHTEVHAQPRLLGSLFQARDRARQRRTAAPTTEPGHAVEPQPRHDKPTRDKGETSPPVSPDSQSPEDPLERLRQAKKRARR